MEFLRQRDSPNELWEINLVHELVYIAVVDVHLPPPPPLRTTWFSVSNVVGTTCGLKSRVGERQGVTTSFSACFEEWTTGTNVRVDLQQPSQTKCGSDRANNGSKGPGAPYGRNHGPPTSSTTPETADDEDYFPIRETRGPRPWRRTAKCLRRAPPCSTNPRCLFDRSGPPPSSTSGGRGQDETLPVAQASLPIDLFGPGSTAFLRAGLGRRTVGPSPATHQRRGHPMEKKRARASPPRGEPLQGPNLRPYCLLRRHCLAQEGKHRSVAVGRNFETSHSQCRT